MNRRQVLKTGGATAIILGGASLVPSASLAAPDARGARAPWGQAEDGFGDMRLDALAYGILAPNPHNKQPWLFALQGDDVVDVRCDLTRTLPETDPPNRQITIGFGAMIALTKMAAESRGLSVQVDPFPEGVTDDLRLDERPIARLRFAEGGGVPDPLFAQALHRRTNREAFSDDLPAADQVAAIVEAGRLAEPEASVPGHVLDAAQAQTIRSIATEAWQIEHATDRTWQESVDVTRFGRAEIEANPDGIAVDGWFMALLRRLGMLSEGNLMKKGSMARNSSLDHYQRTIDTARGFVTLTAEDDTPEGRLVAGQQWLRMQLKATELGIAFHPLSQALQEFGEMERPYRRIHDVLAPDGVVHMLARIGYAATPQPAPRWPLEAKLVEI